MWERSEMTPMQSRVAVSDWTDTVWAMRDYNNVIRGVWNWKSMQ